MSTIAAISTPIGQGGIGIIRISGEKALEIIKKIFQYKKKNEELKSYTMKYGHIFDNEELIDEVLVSYFKAPNSYTGEDVCEINCHGGNLVVRRVLEVVLKNGAVLAEPGEFTKRAFLNGKLDLSQAEAVIDVINSKSEKENKASLYQLEGYLGRKIKEIKEDLIDILVDIEANIDYPEYDVEEVQRARFEEVLEQSLSKVEKLEKSFDDGKILKEGINTVIIGKPNVGKSSLLNALVKEDRAIVTEIAGTTRDTIEESITIKGIPLKIIDTAGIRETNDVVEGIGVEKSKKALEKADLVLMLLDATTAIQEEDKKILELIKNKNYIVLINKVDMDKNIKIEEIETILKTCDSNTLNTENRFSEDNGDTVDIGDIEDSEDSGNVEEIEDSGEKKNDDCTNNYDSKEMSAKPRIIEISAKEEIGIEVLEEQIEEMFHFNQMDVNNEIVITNARHKEAITNAKKEIQKVLLANQSEVPIDMLSIDLQNAVQYLGEITGESVSEDVINGIFQKFCLGK